MTSLASSLATAPWDETWKWDNIVTWVPDEHRDKQAQVLDELIYSVHLYPSIDELEETDSDKESDYE